MTTLNRATRQPIIPLTGSDVTGPLGLAHVPRLWQLGTFARTGLLIDRRTTDPRGFDVLVTGAVGLNLRNLHGHLATLPSYAQCEAWIHANAQNLNPTSIERVNAAVARAHDNLPAWDAFHSWLLTNRPTLHEPIIPAISSRSGASTGLGHLGRLWVKLLLDAANLLAPGYSAGRSEIQLDTQGRRARVPATDALDVEFCEEFGVDVDAAVAQVRQKRPTYGAFERWFIVQATRFGERRVAPYNAQIAERSLHDDLRDWERLHAIALSTGIRPTGGATGGRRR